MPGTNLKSLIDKLNTTCRKAMEAAAGLCLSQTHYEVEIEHFLLKLADLPHTDFKKIIKYFEINESKLIAGLMSVMESFKTGNARNPALSPHIPRMIKDAWLIASVDYYASKIRSGHIILALLDDRELFRMLVSGSDE